MTKRGIIEMAEKELLIREKFDHSGVFDFKGFYSYAHSWFIDERFGVVEDKYSEKVSGNARDLLIEWTVTKKLSDYFKIEIKVKFEISGLTDVEVEIDGERKKMNKGKVATEIKGSIVKDPDSKWDSTAFYRFLRDVYNKYVIPGRIKGIEYIIEGDVRTFKEELKAYLELSGRR